MDWITASIIGCSLVLAGSSIGRGLLSIGHALDRMAQDKYLHDYVRRPTYRAGAKDAHD